MLSSSELKAQRKLDNAVKFCYQSGTLPELSPSVRKWCTALLKTFMLINDENRFKAAFSTYLHGQQ